MSKKKSVADRFSVRLTATNKEFFKQFLNKEPDIDPKNKSGGTNLIFSRYFLYEKYADLIQALENLIRRSK